MNLASDSGKRDGKRKKSSKRLLVTMPWGERIVFSIQTWAIFGWRMSAFKSSLHKSHGWKGGECSHTRQRTSTKHHFGEIAGTLDLPNGICQWIPRVDLKMRRISAKSVPRTLTSGNFRPIKPRLWYSTLLPRLIWPLIISSRFRELNRSYEGVLSRMPLKFKEKMTDDPTRDSKKVGFSGISSNGKGPGVYNRKWTTLKVSLYIINDSLRQLIGEPSYANNDDKNVPQLVSSADPCKRRDQWARREGIRPHSQLKHTFLPGLKEFCLHCSTICLIYGQLMVMERGKNRSWI